MTGLALLIDAPVIKELLSMVKIWWLAVREHDLVSGT
jgi:hypothetical protein